MTPLATGPNLDDEDLNGRVFYETDIAIVEHNVDWASNTMAKVQEGKSSSWMERYLKTIQTTIIVSKKSKDSSNGDQTYSSVSIYEMFDK